jgi:hypothetical protein
MRRMDTPTQTPPSRNSFGAVFSVVVGVLFVVGAVWLRNVEARERVTLHETSGTVVDSLKHREHNNTTGKDSDSYEPVIEFQVNGVPTRFTGSRESYQQSNGNQVVVRYDPGSPATTARVVDAFEGLVPWTMFGMGGIGLLSGLGELLGVRRLFRRTP